MFHGEADYVLVRWLLHRGVALTYLLAFLVAARQFRPLAGEDGLLPLEEYVDRRSFRESPSLFHRFPDDRVIGVAAWTGVVLSALAFLGVTGWFGTPVSVLSWGLLWALYLSFVNAGQVFYGYGWESLLLETGFLTVFLGAPGVAVPAVVIWLLRWVLFRNKFGAGLIKLRGDDCWRDLTCMDYHYETQPMPNPTSWYAHHLPGRLHRAAVLVNHVVELAVPFLLFAPQPVAAFAGLATIAFQAWLMLTGNFSWLNFLTGVLGFAALSDGVLTALLPVGAPQVAPAPPYLAAAAVVLAVVVIVLSYYPVRNLLSSRQRMNAAFDPLHLVNSYGAFGSITKDRYELVVQGTDVEDPEEGDWRTYEFPGKPTDTGERPPQVAPYHLRLDWQLWFAAMPGRRRHPWLDHLLAKLLRGDDGAESLLATVPFDDPPEQVRVVRYRYRYTTPAERRETGDWWRRERTDTYVEPVSLDDRRFRRKLARRGWLD